MLTFNKSSLHYKLALMGGLSKYRDDTDICSYTRKVLLGMIAVFVCAVIVGALSMFLSHMAFAIVFSIMYGTVIITEAAIAGYMMLGTVLIGLLLYKLIEYKEEHRYDVKPRKPDGFMKHAYKSWKEEYCVRVVLKDDNT